MKKSRLSVSSVAVSVACVVSALGWTSTARASDLEFPIKAPPAIPDLSWRGISVIGAIDVSGMYQANGAPYVGMIYSPTGILAPFNRSPQWLIAPNQSLQSFIGLKVEEPLTSNLKFIARAEMGFNPTTGDLADGLKSLQRNNGIPLNQQTVNADASRAGQILNGEAWVGFDSKPWGVVHIGRNNTVSLDMLGAYDPLASLGFSLYGAVSFLAGNGSAETARVDQSIKYLNSYGPFRTEIMYGAPNTNVKNFLQGTLGYVQPNFSIDFLGGHTDDSVSASSLGGAANLGSDFLGARIYNTDLYGVFAKYVFNVGGNGPLNTTESKFTLSGGYQRIIMSNPTDGGYGPGHTTFGGYQIGPVYSTNGSIASGIVNYGFTGGDRKVDMSFIAGKYQYNSQLSMALAYYRFDGNSYGFGVNSLPGIVAPIYSNVKCSSSSFTNCAGNEQVVSFRADYQWTKNFMLYAGVAYTKVSGGLAFSYLKDYTYNPTAGVRFTF